MRYATGWFYACMFVGLTTATSSAIGAAESNDIYVKMLHVTIRADVNEVRFDNIWVLARGDVNYPGDVSVDLPQSAFAVELAEPNESQYDRDKNRIYKQMGAETLIEALSFSYSLVNQKGSCLTAVLLPCEVDLMIVYVAGSQTGFAADLLRHNEFLTSRSRYSTVYKGEHLPAGGVVNMKLSKLPRKTFVKAYVIICVAGSVLIVIAGLLIICFKGK